MAENPKESYPLFSLSNPNQLGSGFGFGFFDPPLKDKDPLPPPTEVITSESPAKSNAEPIAIADGLTLLKGKVNTFDVFGVSNSDLVPGKYEGGLKLWEGSVDLVKALHSEVREGRLMLKGKRVLELGCGHGLPGIFTSIEGAATVHFQDFNAEVLQFLTIPNVKINLAREQDETGTNISPDVHFFSGDWSEIHHLLLPRYSNDQQKASDDCSSDGYDVILMAETVYALSSLTSLYGLIKKCLFRPSGVVYMAGKKHYFGVGGGTRQFLHVVKEDGVMEACLVAEVADGSSNVREVWKFSFKQYLCSSSSVAAMHSPIFFRWASEKLFTATLEMGYQRLLSEIESTSNLKNGGVLSLQSSSRRLKSCCISTVSLPRKVVEVCGEIMNTMKLEGTVFPAIIFSSQWGFPVLAHPSMSSKDRMICK